MSRRATGDQVNTARELADLLEREGWPREFAVNDLLSWFAVRRLDRYAQERIQDAFDVAGITATPSLREAGRGGYVVVSKRGPEPAAVSYEPPQAVYQGPTPSAAPLPVQSDGAEKPRSRVLKSAARGTVKAVGLALLGAFVIWAVSPDRWFDHTWWHVKGLTSEDPTECDDTGWLRPIKNAEAYANFYEGRDHVADKTTDDDRNTAWIQTLMRSEDVPDRIGWTFEPDEWQVRLVCIRNGWALDQGTHTTTGQLNEIRLIGLRDDRTICTKRRALDLQDKDHFGRFVSIPFNCGEKVEKVRLYIDSIHPVSESPDLVGISDVRFYE